MTLVEARVVAIRFEQVEHAVLEESAAVAPPVQVRLHGHALLEPLVGDVRIGLRQTRPVEYGALEHGQIAQRLGEEQAARADHAERVLDAARDILHLASVRVHVVAEDGRRRATERVRATAAVHFVRIADATATTATTAERLLQHGRVHVEQHIVAVPGDARRRLALGVAVEACGHIRSIVDDVFVGILELRRHYTYDKQNTNVRNVFSTLICICICISYLYRALASRTCSRSDCRRRPCRRGRVDTRRATRRPPSGC